MDFVNDAKLVAGWTLGFERDGRELIVIAIKSTYALPRNDEAPRLADEQVPLVESDVFTGAPGLTATVYESDYAHRKPMCDVLVIGSAHAPGGRPVKSVEVGLRVGAMKKVLRVTGPRRWRHGLLGARAGEPLAFVTQPIGYDHAYGGVSVRPNDAGSTKTYLTNPVGCGYAPHATSLHDQPMPHTEEVGHPIDDPAGHYRPMALGPIGRAWAPRAQFAGTYDQAWLDERAPFWPDDFDYRHFQAAPQDQWIPYPVGGEEVTLQHLSTHGHLAFRLPELEMPVLLIPHRGRDIELHAAVDTLLIEPDQGRFSLTWRVSYAPPKSCFDLKRIVPGKTSRQWRGTRRADGKPHFASLADLIQSKKAR